MYSGLHTCGYKEIGLKSLHFLTRAMYKTLNIDLYTVCYSVFRMIPLSMVFDMYIESLYYTLSCNNTAS